MTNNLFGEFSSVSAKQWKQKIQFDLNGDDYNNTLVWKNNEGINVTPFYHNDNFKTPPKPSHTMATQWKICQSIFVADTKKSNKKAIEISKNGVERIQFIIPSDHINISALVNNIDTKKNILQFDLCFFSEVFIKNITKIVPSAIINVDPIGQLARTGNWFNSLPSDFKIFQNITKITSQIHINADFYKNAGANITQQLAYALAHANEYLNLLNTPQNKVSPLRITFHVAVGTNYFFEIAKLRALRILWHTLALEYGINSNCNIVATPTKRNKTLYDNKTNLLRTSTECMSAILGGANAICNLPFDYVSNKSNAFSERIARDQLLILKHEGCFSKVNNPTDGTYYIETLVNQISKKGLELFKDIEANGGFLKQLKLGLIQKKIKENASITQNQFNEKTRILVGTNKYQNSAEKMKGNLNLYPFIKIQKRKTLIEPIIERRLAEPLEQKRLKNEN